MSWLQDIPLITNVGTEFQIRPVNYFDQLASLDVADVNDFPICTPLQGNTFDYTYDSAGDNENFNKMAYKYARWLNACWERKRRLEGASQKRKVRKVYAVWRHDGSLCAREAARDCRSSYTQVMLAKYSVCTDVADI